MPQQTPAQPPAPTLTPAAAALGATPVSALTYQQWLFGLVLGGLSAIPNYIMRDVGIAKATEVTNEALNALTAPPPVPANVAPPLTPVVQPVPVVK
jgi:hypothetical protein